MWLKERRLLLLFHLNLEFFITITIQNKFEVFVFCSFAYKPVLRLSTFLLSVLLNWFYTFKLSCLKIVIQITHESLLRTLNQLSVSFKKFTIITCKSHVNHDRLFFFQFSLGTFHGQINVSVRNVGYISVERIAFSLSKKPIIGSYFRILHWQNLCLFLEHQVREPLKKREKQIFLSSVSHAKFATKLSFCSLTYNLLNKNKYKYDRCTTT